MGAVQITRLREATAADHEAVEGAVPLLRADLSAALYRATLERIYGLVAPWEQRASETAPMHLRMIVEERMRGELLVRDLEALGAEPTQLPMATLPELPGSAELLGAMYVMEGSRLGGQLLARHVERVLGDVGRHSVRYLRGFGESTGAMWKQFVEVIEVEVPEAKAEQAVGSAQRMFRVFGAWMQDAEWASMAGVPRSGSTEVRAE